jgi:hypothetical protein
MHAKVSFIVALQTWAGRSASLCLVTKILDEHGLVNWVGGALLERHSVGTEVSSRVQIAGPSRRWSNRTRWSEGLLHYVDGRDICETVEAYAMIKAVS